MPDTTDLVVLVVVGRICIEKMLNFISVGPDAHVWN